MVHKGIEGKSSNSAEVLTKNTGQDNAHVNSPVSNQREEVGLKMVNKDLLGCVHHIPDHLNEQLFLFVIAESKVLFHNLDDVHQLLGVSRLFELG